MERIWSARIFNRLRESAAIHDTCSDPMAQVGAHFTHKIPGKQLKYIFIVVMIYMGLKMIGVFSWLGLPI